MTDNTRAAIETLDAMLNRIAGASMVIQDGEWVAWALVAKLTLKRRLDRVPAERLDDEAPGVLLGWLADATAHCPGTRHA